MPSGRPTKSELKDTRGLQAPFFFGILSSIATRHPPTLPTIMKQVTFFTGSREPIAKKNKDLREYLRVNRERHKRKLERAFMKATLAEYASA